MPRGYTVVLLLLGGWVGGLVLAWEHGVFLLTLKVLAVVSAGVTVCLCYLCYSPAPPGVTEPWKTTLVMSFMRFAGHIVYGYKTYGFGESFDVVRATFGRAKPPCPIDDARLNIIDTTFGSVKVRVYQPKSGKGDAMPGLLFLHGGGWAIGLVEQFGPINRLVAIKTGAVVVHVDYRLAPEHKFPAAFEDCLHATEYFLQHAEEFNVDSSRIGLLGESSGGNLAAAVALKLNRLENKALPRLKLQSLLYPPLQALDFRTDSYKRGDCIDIVTIHMMTFYWCIYLTGSWARHQDFSDNNHVPLDLRKLLYSVDNNESTGLDELDCNPAANLPDDMKNIINPYFAPLMAEDDDLRGLPPTYIITCGFDVLGDDGIMYAKRLESLGVPVTHRHYEGAFHGITYMGFKPFSYELGREALKAVVTFIRENL